MKKVITFTLSLIALFLIGTGVSAMLDQKEMRKFNPIVIAAPVEKDFRLHDGCEDDDRGVCDSGEYWPSGS